MFLLGIDNCQKTEELFCYSEPSSASITCVGFDCEEAVL